MELVDYVEHSPTDYFHFGLACFGILIAIAGVVTVKAGIMILGGVLIAMALVYFLLQD